MRDSTLSYALAKAIAVAAWADGIVKESERDCLKDLLFQLPGLDRRQWRALENLLAEPVPAAEAQRVMNRLADQLNGVAEQAYAVYALRQVVEADGEVTPEEEYLLERFEANLSQETPESLVAAFQRLLRRPMERRDRAANLTETELASVDDVVAGRLADWIEGDLGLEQQAEEDLRRLCLAGILIARVVHADDFIDEGEVAAAIAFLVKRWHLAREQAEFVLIVSLSDAFSVLDETRVSRWFYELTDLRERRRFLDLLFEIALADKLLDDREVDEILRICANLRLDHLDFEHALSRARQRVGLDAELTASKG